MGRSGEQDEFEAQDEDFAALFAASQSRAPTRGSRTLRAGERVEGVVVEIGAENIFIDVGAKSEARIAREQLAGPDGRPTVSVGDRVRATVKSAGRDGVELTIGIGGVGLAAIEMAYESGAAIEATVTREVKGGLELQVGSARAFCPASQAERTYTPELGHLVGQTVSVKVVEIRDGGRSVVVSRRAVLDDERAEMAKALRERIEVGGLEGLVHISQMGHGRVDRVEDVVSVGEQVKVRVLSVEAREGNPDDVRVSLSMKLDQAAAGEPGERKDQVYEGVVAQHAAHGVFVDTEIGRGLVPQRELGLPPGGDPRRAHPLGSELRVVLLSKDGSGKLRFSARGVADAEARSQFRDFRKEQRERSKGGKGLGSLGELLRDKLPEDALKAKKPAKKQKPGTPAKKSAAAPAKQPGKKNQSRDKRQRDEPTRRRGRK